MSNFQDVCGDFILPSLRQGKKQMSFFSCELNGKGFCLYVLFLNLCQAGVLINIDYYCNSLTFGMHAVYTFSIVYYVLTSEPFFFLIFLCTGEGEGNQR